MANRNIAIVFTFCYLIITKTIRETKFKIGKSCLGVIPVAWAAAVGGMNPFKTMTKADFTLIDPKTKVNWRTYL